MGNKLTKSDMNASTDEIKIQKTEELNDIINSK